MEAPPVLVLFAVKEEATPFNLVAKTRPRTRIVFSGMGRRNAELSIKEAVARFRPGLVLTCGFAGGLSLRLPAGTVVFAHPSDAGIEMRLLDAGAIGVKFHCAEKVVSTAAEKRALHESTGADAVEMESAVIAAVCAERGVPCTTVRVILDAADQDLPLDFNQLMTPDLKISRFKLAKVLIKSPGKIGELKRFQQQCQKAAAVLAAVLAKTIPA